MKEVMEAIEEFRQEVLAEIKKGGYEEGYRKGYLDAIEEITGVK